MKNNSYLCKINDVGLLVCYGMYMTVIKVFNI